MVDCPNPPTLRSGPALVAAVLACSVVHRPLTEIARARGVDQRLNQLILEELGADVDTIWLFPNLVKGANWRPSDADILAVLEEHLRLTAAQGLSEGAGRNLLLVIAHVVMDLGELTIGDHQATQGATIAGVLEG